MSYMLQSLQRLIDISSAVPAVAANILNAGNLQGNIALLCMDLQVVIQQPLERISLALGCCVMDGRSVKSSVLNKGVGSLLYQVTGSKTVPADQMSQVVDSTMIKTCWGPYCID